MVGQGVSRGRSGKDLDSERPRLTPAARPLVPVAVTGIAARLAATAQAYDAVAVRAEVGRMSREPGADERFRRGHRLLRRR